MPMLFGDLQFQSQLDMMGSQAMYQKQLDYWNAPYFSADYLNGFTNGTTVEGMPGYGF
jgi:hypothetical protein